MESSCGATHEVDNYDFLFVLQEVTEGWQVGGDNARLMAMTPGFHNMNTSNR